MGWESSIRKCGDLDIFIVGKHWCCSNETPRYRILNHETFKVQEIAFWGNDVGWVKTI